MSDTDLRVELERVTAERDALLAERERTAPVVAAAKAYVDAATDALHAETIKATREVLAAWERSATPRAALAAAAGTTMDNERDALFALVEAASALPTDGGSR